MADKGTQTCNKAAGQTFFVKVYPEILQQDIAICITIPAAPNRKSGSLFSYPN